MKVASPLTGSQLAILRVFADGAVAGYTASSTAEGMDLWVDHEEFLVCINIHDTAEGDDAPALKATVHPLINIERDGQIKRSQDAGVILCHDLFTQAI